MSKLDTVRLLIQKAGRTDTPIEEASATALRAARMIVQYGFTINEQAAIIEDDNSVPFPDDFEVPDFFNHEDMKSVEPFKLGITPKEMLCVKCQSTIRKGIPYAFETQKRKPRVTHFECRSYFIEG